MAESETGVPMTAIEPAATDVQDTLYTGDDILAFIREVAAISTPAHARIHRAADRARVRTAARVAQDILNTHLALRRRTGRGARTGRRQHAQAIYQILDATNDGDLELAEAALSVVFMLDD